MLVLSDHRRCAATVSENYKNIGLVLVLVTCCASSNNIAKDLMAYSAAVALSWCVVLLIICAELLEVPVGIGLAANCSPF